MVQSLDTESCVAALTRFIARRSYPKLIISDNGTNFLGAAIKLRAFKNEWDKAKIACDLAQKMIVRKLDPPGAPYCGRIWERLVQGCIKVGNAIEDNRIITDEVLSTTMCLVEQTLNARPLVALSDDPEDLIPHTTNHFMLERENASSPFMSSIERYHNWRKSLKWLKHMPTWSE